MRQIPQECLVEETDVLVSRVMEKTIEVVKLTPQERVHGDTVQDVKRPPQEQVQSCTAEQIVDAPVPHVIEEIFKVVKRQRVQRNTVEAAKFNLEETGQVIQRIEQGRVRGRGGGDKMIYVKCQDEVRQVQEEELQKLVTDGSGDVYAVHGGRIVTARMIDRLRDGAMIQLVNRMPGGGKKKKKKMAKKMMEESERSVTDKSSTEADAVFEMFGAEMTDAMLGMSDDKTEEMLKRMRSNLPEEVGNDPEPVIEEIRRFLQEQRWRGRDQQEETRVQSTDEKCRASKTSREGGSEGGFRSTEARQNTKRLRDDGGEDERVRVAPNMGGRWLTPPGHVGSGGSRRGCGERAGGAR